MFFCGMNLFDFFVFFVCTKWLNYIFFFLCLPQCLNVSIILQWQGVFKATVFLRTRRTAMNIAMRKHTVTKCAVICRLDKYLTIIIIIDKK